MHQSNNATEDKSFMEALTGNPVERTSVGVQTESQVGTAVVAERLTGTVKWFNNKAGFGFLTVCGDGEYGGKDIFVHYSSIRVSNSQYKYLIQGEYVDFTLDTSKNDKHEYHAMDISGVKGGPIMCETRRNDAHTRTYGVQGGGEQEQEQEQEQDGGGQYVSQGRRGGRGGRGQDVSQGRGGRGQDVSQGRGGRGQDVSQGRGGRGQDVSQGRGGRGGRGQDVGQGRGGRGGRGQDVSHGSR